MNKITLILQEKSVITELAKDESVKIRIADAIIDGIRKRSSKIIGTLSDNLMKEIESTIYDRNMWGRKLNDKVKNKISEQVERVVSSLIIEEVDKMEKDLYLKLKDIKTEIEQRIEKIDIEPFVEKYVKKILKEKFSL